MSIIFNRGPDWLLVVSVLSVVFGEEIRLSVELFLVVFEGGAGDSLSSGGEW